MRTGNVSYEQQGKLGVDEMALEGTEQWSPGRERPKRSEEGVQLGMGHSQARVTEGAPAVSGRGRCLTMQPWMKNKENPVRDYLSLTPWYIKIKVLFAWL